MTDSKEFLTRRLGNTLTLEFGVDGASLGLADTELFVEGSADATKRVRFEADGITAATTRVITLPDYDVTLGSGVGGLRSVVDTEGVFATPIVLTSADSGKTYLLDDAAGLDFTLPVISAATVGMHFRFVLVTEVTSNSYRITAGEATDLFIGNVIMLDKDTATGDANALISLFRPDVSNDDALTIAGADDTTGALVGGWVEFEAISATRWFVRGVLIGDGALATVFA
jgi:hypothetical protein